MKKLLFLLVLLAMGGGAWYYFGEKKEEAPQYQTVTVSRGTLTQSVTATGTLKPVTEVTVGSQISGNIQKLMADFNSEVKKGEIIAQLDPATFQAALNQAEGELQSAEAALQLAELTAKRQRELTVQKIGSTAELDEAEARLKQAQATVKIRSAQVEKSRVDLGRCTIYAPIDGIVISRAVEVGQTVAASLQAPVMFVIANELRDMEIYASVAEADIGSVEVGQITKFTVDAFPFRTFEGTVKQVRNAPITVQNVVTYETIIAVNNEDLKLKPGMTANVSIVIAEKHNALRVQNAAMRYRPPAAPSAKPSGPAAGTSASPAGGAPSGATAANANGGPPGGVGSGERRGRREGGGPGSGGPGGSGGGSRKRDGGGTAAGSVQERTVYKLVDGKPEPVKVKLGITDGIQTEVLEGLSENDVLVTGTASSSGPDSGGSSGRSPFGGGGMRRF